ncbi:MAG: hypothetical protein ACJ78M_11325 [Gemmatimonadaceae bacterium]
MIAFLSAEASFQEASPTSRASRYARIRNSGSLPLDSVGGGNAWATIDW